jgi:phosphoserine aminotransferase
MIKYIKNRNISCIMKKISILNKNFTGYNLCKYQKDRRVINFSPGPSQLPKEVLDEIKHNIYGTDKLYSYGITPFEISHRSPQFMSILNSVNSNMKKLMDIPDDFSILWTQGGAHGQFSAIPLNILNYNPRKKANYLVTGTWSYRAFEEASKFGNIYNSYDKINKNLLPLEYIDIPTDIKIDNDEYVYICSNETINGIEFREDGIPYPNREILKGSKLVVDMSSDFCMKKIDWEKIDVAFACTSKNLGIPGANITILRKDIIKKNKYKIPCILDWNIYYETNSLYNTPSIFNIYIIDIILKHYIEIGGIEKIESLSREKSKIVYNFLDKSKLFSAIVHNKNTRSNINIPFIVGDGNVYNRGRFLDYCYKKNIVGLRTETPFNYGDYKLTEPLRLSLYNGITLEDTKYLLKVMKDFEEIYN